MAMTNETKRITLQFPHWEHIELYCINHPEKRWSTKNIDYIGARSIFYNLHDDPTMGPECECSCRDLRPIVYPELPDCVAE